MQYTVKTGFNFNWSTGNSKLKKDDIISFNLPAWKSLDGFKVCPQALHCVAFCYARQGRYLMNLTVKPREENLRLVREKLENGGLIAALVRDVEKFHQKWTAVRIHDSGDFFSEEYFLAWKSVAELCPWLVFYAYTKQIVISQRYDPLDNFRIVQSYGGREDRYIDTRLPHSKVFPTVEQLEENGYVNGTHSDVPARNGIIKIGLAYHGTRKLTEYQKKGLDRVNA